MNFHPNRIVTRLFTRLFSMVAFALASAAFAFGDDSGAKNFNVPAGPAEQTLKQFSAQSGAQLAYAADQVKGIRTNAIAGKFHPLDALIKMLDGTSLVAVEDQPGAFAVRRGDDPPAAPTTSGPSAPHPAAATGPAGNEVVTLSEFDVKAAGDTYIASEDLSGSRLAGKIVEEPFDIQSVTKQFILDFDLTGGGGDEALSFVAGYSHMSQPMYQGGFANVGTIGGFKSTTAATSQGVFWDGISHNGYVPDVSMIDGVELIKGPESTLYGDAQPGGMINYIMKRPSTTPEYGVSATMGTYDYFRFELDASGPVFSDKLYYLAAVTSTRREANQNYSYYWNKTAYLRTLYKPFSKTSVIVSFEDLQTVAPKGTVPVPEVVEGATISSSNPFSGKNGVAEFYNSAQFPFYNAEGPMDHTVRNFIGLDVQWQQQISENWSFQVTGDRYTKTLMGNFWTSADYYAVTGRYGETLPETEEETIQLAAFMSDVIGKVQTGPIKHTIQFGFNTSEQNYREDVYEANSAGAALIPNTELYESPVTPDWTPFNYALITPGVDQLGPDGKYVSRLLRYIDTPSEFASERMFLWNDRLILMGNVAHDVVYENITDLAALQHGVLDTDGNTYAIGGNFKVLGNDSLVLFGNKSTGFDSEAGIDLGTDSIEKPEKAQGYEAGFKSALLNEKLDFTLAWFQNVKDNINISNPAYLNPGAGIPEYLGSGTDYVHGVTMDASSHLTDNISLVADFAYMPSKLVAAPNTPANVGLPLVDVPKRSFGFAARYQFRDGWPKGLSVGVSTNYQSSIIESYATSSAYQFVETPTLFWNAFVNYSWKTGRLQHRAGLNFKNIFNRYYLDYSGSPYPGATIYFTYALKFL